MHSGEEALFMQYRSGTEQPVKPMTVAEPLTDHNTLSNKLRCDLRVLLNWLQAATITKLGLEVYNEIHLPSWNRIKPAGFKEAPSLSPWLFLNLWHLDNFKLL